MKKILYRCWLLAIGCWLLAACTETVSDAKQETAQPDIYPDYIGVTIPVNIAPLNFSMTDETALRIDAVITDRHGHELHSQGDDAVDFDLDDWHTLLGDNRGDSLTVTVSAKYDDGWHTYRPFGQHRLRPLLPPHCTGLRGLEQDGHLRTRPLLIRRACTH